MIGRFNLFWLGAGGFLTLFCVNEIIAFHLSKTPKWLGGPLVYFPMFAGVVLGLSIALFLGIEEPREAHPAGAAGEGDEGEGGEDPEGEDRSDPGEREALSPPRRPVAAGFRR